MRDGKGRCWEEVAAISTQHRETVIEEVMLSWSTPRGVLCERYERVMSNQAGETH